MKQRTAQIEGGNPIDIVLQMAELIQNDPELDDFARGQSLISSLMQQETKYRMAEITGLIEAMQEKRALEHFQRREDDPTELVEQSGYSLLNDFLAVLNYINQDKALKAKLKDDPDFIVFITIVLLTSGSVYLHKGIEMTMTIEKLVKNSNGRSIITPAQKKAVKAQFDALLNLLV